MPIYDKRAAPLMEKFRAVNDSEGFAIKALLEYMQSGGIDQNILLKLSENMESAHNHKMLIYQELQQYRIDE